MCWIPAWHMGFNLFLNALVAVLLSISISFYRADALPRGAGSGMYATLKSNYFMLMWEQPLGIVSPANPANNVVTANQILANARSMRKMLAAQSTEASKRLSDAALDIILYSEKVESTARLLTWADSCIGQIRAWMHALEISIHLPSAPDTITLSDSGSMPIIPVCLFCSNTQMNWFLMKQQISLWGLRRCSICFMSC